MKIEVLKKMIEYFKSDVERINHAFKVLDFAIIMAYDENIDKISHEIIVYSAILHDIGILEAERKYGSSRGKYQEMEGPYIAREILTDLNIHDEIVDRVCYIVGHHHSYTMIDGMDFQIVVEADFLVNMFEDDLEREAIKNIKENIFKTDSGLKLVNTMYLGS
jgi:HD superfamily phosphodiesterase